MRLFFISPRECQFMKDLIPGIFSVYQLEQEFHPYLTVEFIPNTTYAAGVLLVVGDKVIRRNYTFNDPNDIIEMRKLIWKYVREIYNPKDITEEIDGKTCIKNFIPTMTFKVTQGWANMLRNKEKGICCKKGKDCNKKAVPFPQQLQKHEVYRYLNKDQINMPICKKLRFGECGDNYPSGTPLYNRCVMEADWLCENGYRPVEINGKLYPKGNINTKLTATFREKLKQDILKYLKRNNMKVDKPMYDLIMSAGFFERPVGRMGNKALPFKRAVTSTDDINVTNFDHYSKLIEGYDGESKRKSIVYFILVIVILIMAGIIFF